MASVRAAVYCLSTLFHRFEFAYCFLQNMFYLRHYLILSSARYWLFIHSLIPTTSALLIVMSLQLFFPLNTRATYCFHNYPVSCVCYISKAQGSIRALSWVWRFSSTSPFHSLSNCFTCCHLCVASHHGIIQARIMEWVAISFSRRSSQPRNWTRVSCIVGRRFTVWATREVSDYLLS